MRERRVNTASDRPRFLRNAQCRGRPHMHRGCRNNTALSRVPNTQMHCVLFVGCKNKAVSAIAALIDGKLPVTLMVDCYRRHVTCLDGQSGMQSEPSPDLMCAMQAILISAGSSTAERKTQTISRPDEGWASSHQAYGTIQSVITSYYARSGLVTNTIISRPCGGFTHLSTLHTRCKKKGTRCSYHIRGSIQ